MAERRIIWTKNAIKNRTDIFDYWNHRNKSKSFSGKLYKEFLNAVNTLRNNPGIGVVSDYGFRHLLVRDYLIFYTIENSDIVILKIWDGNRNPEGLKF